jgi:hypothetical protein
LAVSFLAKDSNLALFEYPNLDSAVSRLSWFECRVKPARSGDHDTLSRYDSFFSRPSLTWVELTQDVVGSLNARVLH